MQDQFLQKIDNPPMQITKNDPDKDLKKKKKLKLQQPMNINTVEQRFLFKKRTLVNFEI